MKRSLKINGVPQQNRIEPFRQLWTHSQFVWFFNCLDFSSSHYYFYVIVSSFVFNFLCCKLLMKAKLFVLLMGARVNDPTVNRMRTNQIKRDFCMITKIMTVPKKQQHPFHFADGFISSQNAFKAYTNVTLILHIAE